MTRPIPTGEWFSKTLQPNGEQTAEHHKADGFVDYWRRKADGTWIRLPDWWHPATFSYQPWRPRIHHSCGRE